MKNIKEYIQEKKEELSQNIDDISLAIVQVGHVPASDRYVRNKIKDCEEVGIKCTLIGLPDTISQEELLQQLDILNKDNTITGYLVQLPLPKNISEEAIKLAIAPSKDVDGFHPLSTTVPATPLGIYTYLKDMGYDFVGKNAVIIGRSNIVGKPIAKLLVDESMNVTVLHSKTNQIDKFEYIKNADLIVVATGHPNTLTIKDYIYKPNAVVIDVGINVQDDGKLIGDCEPSLPVAFQSPVPGGVGLLTRLAVIINLKELANGSSR